MKLEVGKTYKILYASPPENNKQVTMKLSAVDDDRIYGRDGNFFISLTREILLQVIPVHPNTFNKAFNR